METITTESCSLNCDVKCNMAERSCTSVSQMRAAVSTVQDDEGQAPSRREPRLSDPVREHYRLIGDTLNICEAACWRAGIPWIFPTKTVRSLIKRYQPPIGQFVQISLVGVNTPTLELYCDDLEAAAPDGDVEPTLYIRNMSFAERFSLCALLVPIAGVCAFLVALSAGAQPVAALLAGVAAGTAVFAVLVPFSLEPQRRYSLYCVLYREVLRRKGLDQPNSGRLPIVPAETKPLS